MEHKIIIMPGGMIDTADIYEIDGREYAFLDYNYELLTGIATIKLKLANDLPESQEK